MMMSSGLRLAAVALAAAAILTGCAGKTPEERFERGQQLLQERDPLGATLEFQDIIKKFPDDPVALRAHMMLGRIRVLERRPDDAIAEFRVVLDKVSQKDQLGKEALAGSLEALHRAERFDDALKLIDEFAPKVADDAGLSTSLTFARAHTLSLSGKMADAVGIVKGLMAQTTNSQELDLYRQTITQFFARGEDTTAALEFYRDELAKATDDAERRKYLLMIAMFEGEAQNYDACRANIAEVTKMYDKAIREELDANQQLGLGFELAQAYGALGNLQGERVILSRILASVGDVQQAVGVVQGLMGNYIRSGDTSAVLTLLKDSAQRFPNGPFAAELARLETVDLAKVAAADTSTLVMRFKADELLVPQYFLEDAPTTGGAAAVPADDASTDSAAAVTSPAPTDSATTAP